VKARDPCKEARRPDTPNGCARRWSRNRAAATIGPIVCEEDGPIPTLNMSKTEMASCGKHLNLEVQELNIEDQDRVCRDDHIPTLILNFP
jgi:hypothetical protein